MLAAVGPQLAWSRNRAAAVGVIAGWATQRATAALKTSRAWKILMRMRPFRARATPIRSKSPRNSLQVKHSSGTKSWSRNRTLFRFYSWSWRCDLFYRPAGRKSISVRPVVGLNPRIRRMASVMRSTPARACRRRRSPPWHPTSPSPGARNRFASRPCCLV